MCRLSAGSLSARYLQLLKKSSKLQASKYASEQTGKFPLLTWHLLLATCILLIAFAFRTHQLSNLPPGLTHDEANHGREAIGVLDGELLFYFPLNYGSEPLYSYTAAGSMALFGEGVFALRLVNVFASILAMAMGYAWAKRAFGWKTAVFTLSITAISFWAVASSREALRAGLMPLFTTTAVYFFHRLTLSPSPPPRRSSALFTIAFGVAVATTVHIYLSSRVAWLMYPAFLGYLALFHHDRFRAAWKSVAMGLLLAGLLVIPLFTYLHFHPEALTRLDMLDGPINALKSGDLRPLLTNVSSALRGFVQPDAGDQFLAYNIPGRPVFVPLTALFFLIGTAVSIWRWRQPNYALLLLWFGAGIVPSLITGATANTTRNMAALTAVYTLPALGFVHSSRFVSQKAPIAKKVMPIAALLWLLIAGGATARDYFVTWGQSPAVRDAYQQNLVETMAYLEGAEVGEETAVSISSTQPNVAHDPSIALVLSPDKPMGVRWMDARRGLIAVDNVQNRAIIPASTPPHPAFDGWLTGVSTVDLRPDDLNPSFTVYDLNLGEFEGEPIANFNDGIALLQAEWLQPTTKAGETASLLTIWRVLDPARVGPKSTPLNTTDVVMFTQVLDESGNVLGQDDRLDAPSWAWQAGDLIVQIHEIGVGGETATSTQLSTGVNEYKAIVGLYDRTSGERLPLTDGVSTYAPVNSLRIR